MNIAMKQFAEEALQFDTLETTDIMPVRNLPEGIDITIGAGGHWVSIEVVHRGILYYKQYGDSDTNQPDFDAKAWVERAAELIDGSPTKALELLFYCTAEGTSMDAQTYIDTYEALNWYDAEAGKSVEYEDRPAEQVVLYDYVHEEQLTLNFFTPEQAGTFMRAYSDAVEHSPDPDVIIPNLIQCLDMLDQLGLSIH